MIKPTETYQSFRDPAGNVFIDGDRVFRFVNKSARVDLEKFLNSSIAQKWLASKNLVQTKRVEDWSRRGGGRNLSPSFNNEFNEKLLIEHEKIAFPSYPYEWSPYMLYASAKLTLDLAEDLLDQDMGIKDATPYNILFQGPTPVFVDLLSFEIRNPQDPIWIAYAQFVRTFLLPLLVYKHFGISLNHLLLTRRDGLEPEEVYRLCGVVKKFAPIILELVSLPQWLVKRQNQDDFDQYNSKELKSSKKAKFILQSLFKRLRQCLNKLRPPEDARSIWSNYLVSNNNYSADHFQAKQQFIRQTLEEYAPAHVLDVGCNTGHFSIIAAEQGAKVVAIDYDHVVIDKLWRRAETSCLDILPLVVDLTRPTPATGWRNYECFSFLDRVSGKFDCVLMLAVIHHMLVTERVPLEEIVNLAASLTKDLLVIEYVDPTDSMFRRLVRGREALYRELTVKVFEEHCHQYFNIVRIQHLERSHRWLYLLRRK